MTSPVKAATNRQNALRSTGPRTLEGKAVSSQNAMKHGLTAQAVLLPDEDSEVFADLRERLYAELKPEGALETTLVDRIATALWRLQRLGQVEVGLFILRLSERRAEQARHEAARYTEGPLAFLDATETVITDEARYQAALQKAQEVEVVAEEEAPSLAHAFVAGESTFMTLSRYEAAIERGLYRALHELQRLQAATEQA